MKEKTKKNLFNEMRKQPKTDIAKVNITSSQYNRADCEATAILFFKLRDEEELKKLANTSLGTNVYIFNDQQRVNPAIFIKEIYVNEAKKTVAVKFADGSLIKKTACEGDTFDVYAGVSLCLAAYLAGSTKNLHKLIDKRIKNSEKHK